MSPADQRSLLVTRREFVVATVLGAAGSTIACAIPGLTDPISKGSARLTARVGTPSATGAKGLRALGLGDNVADGVIYVPASYTPSTPAPLVLLLHGAGGSGANFITRFIPEADATGQVLIAPDSRKTTWDAIGGSFGTDVSFIDSALKDAFSRYSIDARRVSVAGFSDGATYALALGLANGDVFPRVTAFSGAALIGKERNGTPSFFITHGLTDPVLPIGSTGRAVVNELRNSGFTVDYREFAGQHELPADLLHAAMVWMAS